ncbi:DUF1822 family protein [Microcoleus sp. B9-D4]|uniref:DUF1822 family protein n=1 Tax=Microcoleus sp. B9-D4 TaxID=2818711 RepID=UPI002FD4112B
MSQILPSCCNKAAKTWEIQKLFNDLDQKYKVLLGESKDLGSFEKTYLCLLLSGVEPNQMCDKLDKIYVPVETIRVKLSTRNGLYDCIRRLTGGQINNWRDPIILFLNKGYRKSEDVKEKEETLLVMTCDVEVSEEILRTLEETMKQILGANQMKIQKIERGSLIIYWQGSRSSYEQIEVLFREGVLSDRLGVPVLEVQVVPNEEQVNLSQWFENIFTAGWQSVEELLTPQQLSPTVWSDRVKQGKLFNLRADLISHAVNLVINLTRASEDKVSVWLQVYPSGENYLPLNLKLLVLAEGEVFKEVTARSADVLIQCQFDADPGDEFSVKLALGEVSVTEKFVL